LRFDVHPVTKEQAVRVDAVNLDEAALLVDELSKNGDAKMVDLGDFAVTTWVDEGQIRAVLVQGVLAGVSLLVQQVGRTLVDVDAFLAKESAVQLEAAG
jgi:hypothetical protein